MNYQQARHRVVTKRVLGSVLAIPSAISTVVSLLKMIYLRIDDGSQIGGLIAHPFKVLVYWIYENTDQLLSVFWELSPTPNLMQIINLENGYFLVTYITIFIGMAIIASGNRLARRLRDINRKIEDQLIEESIKGQRARTREDIEKETEIPKSGIFSQFHQLYLAPVIVGLLLALMLKLLGI